MCQVLQDCQETGVLQVPLVLDLRDLQERRVSRAFQEDPDRLVHLVLKVSQV